MILTRTKMSRTGYCIKCNINLDNINWDYTNNKFKNLDKICDNCKKD